MEDGKAAFRAKDYKKAAKLFKQAYDLDQSLKTGLYNRAFALRKGNHLQEARTAYLEFISVNPEDNDGLFGLAETERLLGNKPESLRLFTEYLIREKRAKKAKYVAYAKKKVEEMRAEAEGKPVAKPAVSGKVADGGSAKAEFDAGNAAYRSGRYRDAAEHFAKAFLKDARRTDALYRRALSLRKAGDYTAAIGAYKAFLDKKPNDLDGLFGLAETHRLADNKGDALRLYERYLAKEKRAGREKYLAYAKKQLAALKAEKAQPSAIDKAVALKLLEQGKAAYGKKSYKEAAGLFKRAEEADPTLAQAIYRQGLALRRAGDLPGAVKAYQRFLESKPDDPDAHYGLAETFRLKGDVAGARRHFTRYVELERRPSEKQYVARAQAYLAKTADQAEQPTQVAAADEADGKEAEQEADASAQEGDGTDGTDASSAKGDKTAKADPKQAGKAAEKPAGGDGSAPVDSDKTAAEWTGAGKKPGVDAATMAKVQGRPSPDLGAKHALHGSALAKRVTVDGLVQHGNAALGAGSPDRAARHFALAAALAPDEPLPALMHGRALEALDEPDAARKQYARVLELTEEGKLATEARARLASTSGAPGRPIATAEQTAKASTLLEEARSQRAANDLEAALGQLKKAAKVDPNNRDVYLLTGDIQVQRGKGLPALQAYQRALALSPNSAAPLFGIARAYELAGERRVSMHHYRLYMRSDAPDVDPDKKREAWMKVEGVSWPPGS